MSMPTRWGEGKILSAMWIPILTHARPPTDTVNPLYFAGRLISQSNSKIKWPVNILAIIPYYRNCLESAKSNNLEDIVTKATSFIHNDFIALSLNPGCT